MSRVAFLVTQEHALACSIADSVKDLQGHLTAVRVKIDQEKHIGLSLQHKVHAFHDLSKQHCSAWSATRTAPEYAPPELLQQLDVQAEVDAAEECIAAIRQQLEAMQKKLVAGREAAHTWKLIINVQSNRWRNSQATTSLLALPPEVLRTIAHKAGKEARLVCTALRLAHGAPGSGLVLARSQHSPPVQHHNPDVPLIDARLATWLQPCDVTQLRALSFLPASTCETLSRTFPRLQAVSILRGMQSCVGLGPHITCLVLSGGGPPQGPQAPLQACISGAFSALQALTVTGCQQLLPLSDLSPLAVLTQLTSLTVATTESPVTYKQGLGPPPCAMDDDPHPSGGDGWLAAAGGTAVGAGGAPSGTSRVYHETEDEWEEEYSDDSEAEEQQECNQGVWGVLAALPKLARLCLDVPLNYHTEMLPGAGPLAALTHLAVQTDVTMATPDRRHGVEVPFLKVLELLPSLLSLHLLEGLLFGYDPAREHAQAVLSEAVRSRNLQHLELVQTPGGSGLAAFATALLTPSLSSFKTNSTLILDPTNVTLCFPSPLPLKSLDIHCSSTSRNMWTDDSTPHATPAAMALPLLCERLPGLTHLTLRLHDPVRDFSNPDVAGPPAPLLTALLHLQQLHVSGTRMAAGVASSLPLLPALTRLELPDMMPPQHVPVLASLSRLQSLRLGREMQFLGVDGAAAILGVVGRMVGLTELVLAHCQLFCVPEPFLMLLPPPVLLRRLVVGHEVTRQIALRVLGGVVDQICVSTCD